MKINSRILVFLMVGSLLGFHAQPSPQGGAQRDPIGQIVEIYGTVYLKANEGAKKKKLDPERDRNRPLYRGQWVLCEKGAYLKILINRVGETVTPSKQWRELVAQRGEDQGAGTKRPSRTAKVNSDSETGRAPVASAPVARQQQAARRPEESQVRASNSSTPVYLRILKEYAKASDRGVAWNFGSTHARGALDTVFTDPASGSSSASIDNASFEIFTKGQDRTLATLALPGLGDVKEAQNGKTAWRQASGSTVADIGPAQTWLVRFSPVSYSARRLMSGYHDWTLLHATALGDKNVYVMRGTPSIGAPETFYFDTRSFLLVRVDSPTETPGGQFMLERYLEDYKEVNGMLMPFTIRGTSPTGRFTFKLSEFKFDVAVDDSIFDKPKRQ